MRSIDIAVVNPVFPGLFPGTAVVGVVAAFEGDAGVGAALHVLGGIVFTAAFHIPRNNGFERLATPQYWEGYLREWVPANHVRVLLSLAAGAWFILTALDWLSRRVINRSLMIYVTNHRVNIEATARRRFRINLHVTRLCDTGRQAQLIGGVMARIVIAMVALALAAVLVPSPFGNAHVMRVGPAVHATAAGSEEEPNRECRKGTEPRSWSTRSSPARPARPPSGKVTGTDRRNAPPRVSQPVGRGREEHLRSWSTPSALQVFRH